MKIGRRLKNRNLLVYLLVMLLEQWEDDLMENKALKRKKEHGEKDLWIDIEEKRCKLRKRRTCVKIRLAPLF